MLVHSNCRCRAIPLNLTVLDPCVAPKFAPAIVTEVDNPDVGFKLVMLRGRNVTVKTHALLALPNRNHNIPSSLPLDRRNYARSLQLVAVAGCAIELDAAVPCVAPKSPSRDRSPKFDQS